MKFIKSLLSIAVMGVFLTACTTDQNTAIIKDENLSLKKGLANTHVIVIESDLPGYKTMPTDGVRDFSASTKITDILSYLPKESNAKIILDKTLDDEDIRTEFCISERTQESPFCGQSFNIEQNIFENKVGKIEARLKYDLILRKKEFDPNYSYYKDYYMYSYSDARTGEYPYNSYYTPTVFTSKFDKKSYIVIISFKKK